jgi:FMN phosphatase YigB (HAD superfamily)
VTNTLLLDLDNTLLGNDINVFIPEYMAAISRHFSPLVEPQQFLRAMQRGTQAMVANRQPDCTLQEAFEAGFFGSLKIDANEFYRLADEFYTEVFPGLRRLTQPIPGAVQMVEAALKRGDRLAVTTNPLFPRTAILQRLEWAGLPVERYPFAMVTSFEKFHFAKPDPAFYAETLGYLGWPSGPVVVTGDDPVRDVGGGKQLGLATYWIAPEEVVMPGGDPAPTGRGLLPNLTPWLEAIDPAALEPDFSSISAMLAILRATPAVLDSLCRDLPGGMWLAPPRPGEWSLTEIACHLRDVEGEVNLQRLQKLLETANPFLSGQDTDAWAETRNYRRQDGRRALAEFTSYRGEVLKTLEALEPDGWQRPARHAIFGPTRLIELVEIMAAHDRLHIQQVQSVLEAISE